MAPFTSLSVLSHKLRLGLGMHQQDAEDLSKTLDLNVAAGEDCWLIAQPRQDWLKL